MRWFLALLLLTGVAIAQSQQPSQQQKTEDTNQQSKTSERGTEQSPLIIKILDTEQAQKETKATTNQAPNKWLDGWTLSDKIAAIAIFVGFLQFCALIATVGVMKATGRRQLRAYVFVAQAKIIDPDGPAPRGEISIKNFGQTPAYDVAVSVTFKGFNPTDPRIFDPIPIDEKSSRFVLAPSHGGCKTMDLGPLLNPGTMASLRARGEHILYAWGLIDYRDAFGTHQTAEFRVSIGGPGGWPESNLMVIDPQGNKER